MKARNLKHSFTQDEFLRENVVKLFNIQTANSGKLTGEGLAYKVFIQFPPKCEMNIGCKWD